jgi:hypothetical protein
MNIAMNRIMKEFKEVVANESVRKLFLVFFSIGNLFYLSEWN